jgi:hypothetical protein
MNNCNEIYGACRHKPRFHRFLKEHTITWKIPLLMTAISQKRSTSMTIKTDLVFWTELSGIITSSGARFWHHPTSRCAWRLHTNPHMCMIIVQWASHLTTTRQPNHELGGSR